MRPATSGSRWPGGPSGRSSSAGTSTRCRTAAGSTGALNVVAGVEVLRRIAEDGKPPVTIRLVELGRRGGRALRPEPLRLERRGRLDGRPGRAPTARGCATGSRCRTRSPSTASTSTAPSRPRASSPRRPHISSCTSSRGPCSSRSASRSGSCSARSASSATGSPGADRRPTRARRRWRSAATRSPERRSSRSRSARSPGAPASGAVCTSGDVVCRPGIVTSVVETAEQLLDQRHLERRKLASMLARGQGRERAVRGRGADRGRVGADLVDRADPLRRHAARLLRRGRRRGRTGRRTGCPRARSTTPPRSPGQASRR